MKKLLIIFIVIIQTKVVFAQCYADSLVTFSKNSSGLFIPFEKIYTTYLHDSLIESEISIMYDESLNKWDTLDIELYEYNNKKSLISTYSIVSNGFTLDTSSAFKHLKNQFGFDSIILFYSNNNSTNNLELASRQISNYKKNNLNIENINQVYNKNLNSWENNSRVTFEYFNNLLVQTIQYSWDKNLNKWYNLYKNVMVYSNDKIIEDSSYSWPMPQSNNWELTSYNKFSYGANDKQSIVRSFNALNTLRFEKRIKYNLNNCIDIDSFFMGPLPLQFNSYTKYYYSNNSSSIISSNLNTISIFPNPTNFEINIKNAENSTYDFIELSNGRILKTGVISNQNELINISEFGNGIYILKLNNQFHRIIKL